jgi:hypothetical protein
MKTKVCTHELRIRLTSEQNIFLERMRIRHGRPKVTIARCCIEDCRQNGDIARLIINRKRKRGRPKSSAYKSRSGRRGNRGLRILSLSEDWVARKAGAY